MRTKLEKIIPWGRSMDEYIRMFSLTPHEQTLSIIDCASSASSFNHEMHRQGYQVISCDPIYAFSSQEIAKCINEVYPIIIGGINSSRDDYVWRDISSVKELEQMRQTIMQNFLQDFSIGLKEKRYIPASLPHLPFEDGQFDLALCSYFLFTYSDHLSPTFHLDAIREMCRVARQVRIFPLINLRGEISPWLAPVTQDLKKEGYHLEIIKVPYEFQKNSNRMLRVSLPVKSAPEKTNHNPQLALVEG
ncbi:MAG: class I SAM-dependent methyltransferase [Xenococcaceae cyanobacterium]